MSISAPGLTFLSDGLYDAFNSREIFKDSVRVEKRSLYKDDR